MAIYRSDKDWKSPVPADKTAVAVETSYADSPVKTNAGNATTQTPQVKRTLGSGNRKIAAKEQGAFVPDYSDIDLEEASQPTTDQLAGLRSLAEGTAESTLVNPQQQKYQTVFNWLTRRDPTVSPWTDFVLHGPRTSIAQSNRSDMEAAQLEQQMLRQQQQGMSSQLTMPQVRLRQQYQAQWDKLLGEWNKGAYSGNEQTEQAFYDEAERLLGRMHNAGMDISTLRMPSINAGGFSQGFNKNLAEPLNNLRELDSIMGNIYENSIKDPNWLNTPDATTLFDKLGERVILDLGKSKGAIADAEKVRIQVEMMPKEIRRMYDNIMMKFFDDNRGLMALASQFNLNMSARATIDALARDFGGENLTTNDGSRNPAFQKNIEETLTPGTEKNTNFLLGVADVFNAIERAGGNVPNNLQAMFSAIKNGIDEFHQYVMQDAPVNMQLVWDLAQRSRKENITKYNDWAQKAGKSFGWKYRTSFNPASNFSQWLKEFQTPDSDGLMPYEAAPVYWRNITVGPSIPNGRLDAKKRNNGRGTI